MPNPGPPLPFPDDLDASRRVQITRLPLSRDAQAYAAWCLRFLAQDMVLGSTLIALHPDVAGALEAILSPDQQDAIAESSAAPVWYTPTGLYRTVACSTAKNPTTTEPIQRRNS